MYLFELRCPGCESFLFAGGEMWVSGVAWKDVLRELDLLSERNISCTYLGHWFSKQFKVKESGN